MNSTTKLRINVNSQAIIKLAGLVSNSIVLSTNAYLLGVNVRRQIKERKAEAVTNKLQLASDVANAVAGLTKVVITTQTHPLPKYPKRKLIK